MIKRLIQCFVFPLAMSVGAASLTGCQMSQPKEFEFKYENENITGEYGEALRRAQGISRKFDKRVRQYEVYDFATGAAIFVASTAALAFGVFDAPRPFLLGAGLATGGFFGIRQFVSWEHRKAIYSEAQGALNCAVQASRFDLKKTPQEDQNPEEPAMQTLKSIPPSLLPAEVPPSTGLQQLNVRLGQIRGTLENLASAPGAPQGAKAGIRKPASGIALPGSLVRPVNLLTASMSVTERAVADVKNNVPSDQERGRRLDAAMDAILIALRKQLAADSFNVNGSLATVRSEVAGSVANARSTAEAARQNAREAQERAAVTAAVAKAEAEADPNSEAAKKAQAAAENAEKVAADLDRQLSEIINRVGIPAACFGTMAGGALAN